MRPAVYANHKRKDGTYPVKIVVYFKRKERKLPTNIVCEKKDLTRGLKLKQGDTLDQANEYIRKLREACSDIPYFDLEYRDVDFVVDYIKNKLTKEHFSLDFFTYAEEWIVNKIPKPQTRKMYYMALKAFERFLGKKEIDINQITHSMIVDFLENVGKEPYMRWSRWEQKVVPTKNKKDEKGQGPRFVQRLGRIFREAKKKYNDEDSDRILIPRNPFDNHDLSTSLCKGQTYLPEDIMQRLISDKTEDRKVRFAIDVAVVSFGMMGANLADLFEAQKPEGEVWIYKRKKTRDRRADDALMRVNIPPCLSPYLERLQSSHYRAMWLGKLKEITLSPVNITIRVNKGLKRWCEREGVERFTFYAIRKTWATTARRIGIDKATVDECLCHVGDYALTDIYAARPWDVLNEANTKVLEQFKWD